MSKINFTSEHLVKLKTNIAEMVLNGTIVNGPMGQSYDVFNLANTLSISSLRTLSSGYAKKKVSLSISDEWLENPNEKEIKEVDFIMETISLLIGYKLKQQEDADNARERARLQKQLDDLKESQKTPIDLITELEAKIAALN